MSGKFALIIGNTEYTDPALRQLTAPANDARDFATILKAPELCAFDDVKVLLDQISSSVIEVIDEFFDQRKPDDLLVLYFSGHGIRDEIGSLYLAFKNTTRSRLRSTAIKSDYIREVMDQSRSKRQVLILDCCNSGAFPQGTKAELGGAMGLMTAFQGYGRYVLTASDTTQFAWEGDRVIGETQNSLFTHFLMKGLEGEADTDGDGQITVDKLYDYAFEQISKATPKQTPTKSSSKAEGDIVLRQITRIEDIKPAPLPAPLLDSLENPMAEIRLAGVQQLTKLLNGKNLRVARSAREALERIAEEDDSRQVLRAASEALEAVRQAEQLAAQRLEEERLAREKLEADQRAEAERQAQAEAQRLALIEQERLAREKAAAERAAREKAEAERLARSKAAEEAAQRQAQQAAQRQEAMRLEAERAEAKRAAERQPPRPAVAVGAAPAAVSPVAVAKSRRPALLALGAVGLVVILGVIGVSLLPKLFPGESPSFTTPPSSTQPTPTSHVLQFQPAAQPPVTGGTLKIVSSFPMTGLALTQAQSMVNAIQLRLAQANSQACGGKYTLAYEPWDDASAATGTWSAAAETDNANKAVGDPSIVAYLGTFNSGTAKLSIPILNLANLVMISPANTYTGLTKANGAEPGEPDKYYPNGTRNYARVVPADDVQGSVDANFMFNTLGVRTVYILDDNSLYGKGVADMFEKTAAELGMTVVGHARMDPAAPNFNLLMQNISTSNNGQPPDGIFAGMFVDSNAPQLLRDKVAIMGDNAGVKFMGPDGLQTQAFIDGAGAGVAEGAYASVAGLAPENYTDAGRKFLQDYEARYGKLTEPYAIYAYETMNVALKAIEDICARGGDPSDRTQVRDAVFAIQDFSGVLGTWSFDANGDTTLSDMTVYEVQNGAYRAVGTFR